MSALVFSILLVGICMFLLSFNIIFKKDGKFPDKEIGENKELKKLGITCAKSQERELWGSNQCTGCPDCSSCGSSKI